MGIVRNRKKSTPMRRLLRTAISEPEQKLWYFLRRKQLKGLKFKRQYSVGRYVVDFYCHAGRLAIEVDGDSHYTTQGETYDQERTEYLNACGIQVMRFTNKEVMENIEEVLGAIASMLPSP